MDRMASVALEITTVLGPHTQVEKHGLFPALAGDFPDRIAALEAEHRRIELVHKLTAPLPQAEHRHWDGIGR